MSKMNSDQPSTWRKEILKVASAMGSRRNFRAEAVVALFEI
jgi:hypothetical protein